MLSSKEIRQKFLEYFEKNGHTFIPSSSLIPDDPSVLLTTAGMQQFKPYFTGKLDPLKDFGNKNIASIQKSFRTSDVDEVGDETHLTFFEMLGNFSFGGYDQKKAIEYAHEFITKDLGLKIDYVTIFGGDDSIPPDLKSRETWEKLVDPQKIKVLIKKEGRENNFWGPTGIEGPCGPTTEIYLKSVEIWNIVFNQFFFPGSREELLSGNSNKELKKTESLGIDTGMGFERLVTIVQDKKSVFETDLFAPIMDSIPARDEKIKRILADHIRASVFLISDGVLPSNRDQGYILRRLLRRAIRFAQMENLDPIFYTPIVDKIVELYGPFYKEVSQRHHNILEVINQENTKFSRALDNGLKAFENYAKDKKITAKEVFDLYQNYGFPIELTEELAKEKGIHIDKKELENALLAHREVSKAGAEKKFGGHGLILNTGELKAGSEDELDKVLRLHTVTHLLQAALRNILGPEVKQAGSDITAERTRFDFNFPRKLTPEEIKQVEDLVNQKIKENLPVSFKEMPKEEAEKTGALYFFKEKYPAVVKVYYVGKDIDSAWSKEFCGGPHVSNTGVIGKFEIIKEESVGSNIRRIRAKVLP